MNVKEIEFEDFKKMKHQAVWVSRLKLSVEHPDFKFIGFDMSLLQNDVEACGGIENVKKIVRAYEQAFLLFNDMLEEE